MGVGQVIKGELFVTKIVSINQMALVLTVLLAWKVMEYVNFLHTTHSTTYLHSIAMQNIWIKLQLTWFVLKPCFFRKRNKFLRLPTQNYEEGVDSMLLHHFSAIKDQQTGLENSIEIKRWWANMLSAKELSSRLAVRVVVKELPSCSSVLAVAKLKSYFKFKSLVCTVQCKFSFAFQGGMKESYK